jgi:pimeloyl-ACP methyl ester carboxylesterase
MGAIVAMHAALRHPGRVRSLLLVCAGADTDPQATLERISLIESAGMGPMVAPMLERWFTMDALTQEPEHPGVAYTRQILRGLAPRTFADDWRVVARHDVRERLHEIHVPTTCVAGNQDKSATPARVGTLAAGIPGARMMVVQGPHLLHLERPQVFSGALGTHLRFVEQSQ